MFKKSFIIIALLASMSAQGQTVGCGSGDLAGASFLKCAGYEMGNLINNNQDSITKMSQLFSSLGYSYASPEWTEKLSSIKGSTIDFNTVLTGTTFLAIHRGSGSPGQSTALYVLDAGTSVDKLQYNLSGLSNAAIYTVATSPVPEPSTWLTMLAGLLGMGFVVKRRLK